MGEIGLTPEERRLKDLIHSLGLVPEDDLDRAAADVRLVRQYGGKVDLKQRLVDLELVGERQLDAIERGLGMKSGSGETSGGEGGEGKEKKRPHIDISRLAAGMGGGGGGLGGLRLDAGKAPSPGGGFHQRAIPGEDKQSSSAADAQRHAKKTIKGGFVPSWKKRAAEQSVEARDEQEKREDASPPPSGQLTIAQQEERVKHIIRHIIHSRMHEQVLDFLIRRKMNIVEPGEVADALGLTQRQVRRVLDELKNSNVIKDIGTHPYALSPGHRELDDLKFFLSLWKQPEWHSKMLAWLLEEEKRRGY